MHPVKRIEIIATSREIDQILTVLNKVGVSGYSVIRDVVGKSAWGEVSDDFDLAASVLSNSYVLCFCMPDQTRDIVESIRPILNKLGGALYVSDAMEVRSVRCVASL